MKPIAVFYHCVLSGNGVPSEDHAIAVMAHQMHALKESGLATASAEMRFYVNGSDGDALMLSAFAPSGALVGANGRKTHTEIPTMERIRSWVVLRPGWAVLYHHSKGASHPNDDYQRWRQCMENVCVWNWRECVKSLESRDTVGPHWLTQEKYPVLGKGQRYWGGNFWWATSDYLMTLPPLPPDTFENRYEAESWIGKARIAPRVHDFAPHWPMKCQA